MQLRAFAAVRGRGGPVHTQTKPMHGAAVAMTNMLAPRRAPASSMTLRALGGA